MLGVRRREKLLRARTERVDDAEVGAFVRGRQLAAPAREQTRVPQNRRESGLRVAIGTERGVPAIGAIGPRYGESRRRERILQWKIVEPVNPVADQEPRTEQRVLWKTLERAVVIGRSIPSRLIFDHHRRERRLRLQFLGKELDLAGISGRERAFRATRSCSTRPQIPLARYADRRVGIRAGGRHAQVGRIDEHGNIESARFEHFAQFSGIAPEVRTGLIRAPAREIVTELYEQKGAACIVRGTLGSIGGGGGGRRGALSG